MTPDLADPPPVSRIQTVYLCPGNPSSHEIKIKHTDEAPPKGYLICPEHGLMAIKIRSSPLPPKSNFGF